MEERDLYPQSGVVNPNFNTKKLREMDAKKVAKFKLNEPSWTPIKAASRSNWYTGEYYAKR